jgi:hypothetical protein
VTSMKLHSNFQHISCYATFWIVTSWVSDHDVSYKKAHWWDKIHISSFPVIKDKANNLDNNILRWLLTRQIMASSLEIAEILVYLQGKTYSTGWIWRKYRLSSSRALSCH